MTIEERKLRAFDWLEAQAKASYTGIGVEYYKGEGYRFMRHHYLGETKPSLLETVEDTMIKDLGKEALGLK